MEDLLAEFENERAQLDEEFASKEIRATFETVEEINDELRPMGYSPNQTLVYHDEEVLDYYESESEDEETSMDDIDLDRDESELPNMPPPALNGGLLRRHNAAIFMPLRVSCLYG